MIRTTNGLIKRRHLEPIEETDLKNWIRRNWICYVAWQTHLPGGGPRKHFPLSPHGSGCCWCGRVYLRGQQLSDDDRKTPRRRTQYTYLADELGNILETHAFMGDSAWDPVLTPFRKPNKPMFIDTPEKLAMWRSYWDNIEGWWDAERSSERRNNGWR